MKRQSFSFGYVLFRNSIGVSKLAFGSIRYGSVLAQNAKASPAKKASTARNAASIGPKKATERVAMLPPFLL